MSVGFMSVCVCDYTMTASQRQQLPALHWGDRQPCQLPPPTEEDRTKRDGEGKRGIKRNEDGNTPDISHKNVIEILLAKRGELGVTCWQTKMCSCLFFSLFVLGKWLCVTPFVSFDRFLVTVDDLWMALSWVWKLLCLSLSHYSISLFFSFLSTTSAFHLSVHSLHPLSSVCI